MATEAESVVADTSVVINLNATGCAARILEALPFCVVVEETAAAELRMDRRSARDDAARFATLTEARLLRTVALREAGQQIFAALVIGPAAETLDDGEAATIAYAAEHGIRPAIDERKALRICARKFPQLSPMSTVDLLMHPAVPAALGAKDLVQAVFQALLQARMRVPPERMDWVVRLIGRERAAQCPSLPFSARHR